MKLESNVEIRSKEIFLDGLVEQILHLSFTQGKKEKFLELALDHQDNYFLDVLELVLKVHKLKDGKFYVVTRENCFEYRKHSERTPDKVQVHSLSNTRYTIPEYIEDEQEKVPDDGLAKNGKPVVQEPEVPRFSGVGNYKQLLDHLKIQWDDERAKNGSAKPFRVMFFDKESKNAFDMAAQEYGFIAVPRTAPYHGFEKLNIYKYNKS